MFDKQFVNTLCKYFLQQGKALPYKEAYELGQASVEAAISGESALTIDTTSILTGLYNRAVFSHEDAPAMIAGLCAAVFKHDIGKSPQGFFHPKGIDYVMENCGMGGDTIITPNVSCLSAICAASAGMTMIKHGSRSHSDSGKCGSSDFLEKSGIPMNLDVSQIELLAKKFQIGYIDAVDTRFKRIHLQTLHRSSVSHLNHIVGPITSPVHPTLLRRRVIGVNQVIRPEIIAKAYQILNEKGITHMEHVLIVRGRGATESDSMDEVSIAEAGSELVSLRNGEIRSRILHAADFGLPIAPFKSLEVPKDSKYEHSMAILEGKIKGPLLDLICANTALLFTLANPSLDLQECTQMARRQLCSGKALDHLCSIRDFLQQ